MKAFFHAFLYIAGRKMERRKEEREGQWVGGKEVRGKRKKGRKETKKESYWYHWLLLKHFHNDLFLYIKNDRSTPDWYISLLKLWILQVHMRFFKVSFRFVTRFRSQIYLVCILSVKKKKKFAKDIS